MKERKPYPSDVKDGEWELVVPYLTLMREDAPQRQYSLRELFNGLRYIARTGAPWRMMSHDLPAWHAVYQQGRRWLAAGVFEATVHDLRAFLRMAQGREAEPSAVILDGRTMQSTPESGKRAGYDGHKKKKGSKVHMAVDTLGHLPSLIVTLADEQERAQVYELAEQIQEETGESVELAFVDQGYTGEQAAEGAAEHRIRLEVVKLPCTVSPDGVRWLTLKPLKCSGYSPGSLLRNSKRNSHKGRKTIESDSLTLCGRPDWSDANRKHERISYYCT